MTAINDTNRADRVVGSLTPSMETLPCELLVEIFSFLEASDLFEMRQVCPRWQTSIDEYPGVWRRKRTITKDDLGVYSSLESKLLRLVYFLKKLPNVDYYYFPVLLGSEKRKGPWINFGITKETEECFEQLYVVLKELFSAGCIPVNLDAVNFMENMSPSMKRQSELDFSHWEQNIHLPHRLESEFSFSECRSIIVPFWPPDKYHVRSYRPWLRYLIEKMESNIEMVIETMNAHSSTVNYRHSVPSLEVSIWPDRPGPARICRPSRVRVLSVVGDMHHQLSSFLPSVRLRPDRQLFSYDEFARLLASLSNHNVIDALMILLDKFQAEGRVQDCQIGESDMRIPVTDLLNCFGTKKVNPWPYPPLVRQMANSPFNDLTVAVRLAHPGEQPASSALDFLRADPFRGVSRLCVNFQSSNETSVAGLSHVWDCLLQEDILVRMEFLKVFIGDFRVDGKRDSRVFDAPVSRIALPRLESLQLDHAGSVTHVCALLSGTPNLRCLRLNLYGLAGDRSEQEHVALRDRLLSAISQLTRLVSLSIELIGPDNSWEWPQVCSWVTHPLVNNPGSCPSKCFRLREEVFVALSRLVHLESLSLLFPDDNHRYSCYFDGPTLQRDMQRLITMLPRLREVVLCENLLRERGQPVEPDESVENNKTSLT